MVIRTGCCYCFVVASNFCSTKVDRKQETEEQNQTSFTLVAECHHIAQKTAGSVRQIQTYWVLHSTETQVHQILDAEVTDSCREKLQK